MKIKELRKKSYSELKNLLVTFYRERFKLLLDKTSGAEFTKNHLLKDIKKNIARVLTIIRQRKNKFYE